ncbi:MAG: hypothetical protein ABFD66_02800 [Smithella sp.]
MQLGLLGHPVQLEHRAKLLQHLNREHLEHREHLARREHREHREHLRRHRKNSRCGISRGASPARGYTLSL